MDKKILSYFKGITEEEQAILSGQVNIDRNIYMQGQTNVINAKKLLTAGKLISIRQHTRFVHFPSHTHDYVEVVYMCTGQTTHIVNGVPICLHQGELLFMNQYATHEVLETGEKDVAVNFIILPEFFNSVLPFVGDSETPLRNFFVDCLCGESSSTDYLHFKVADIKAIQNLIENLLFIFLEDMENKWKMSQMTMVILFMHLMDHTDALHISNQGQATIFKVLRYIESHYASGSLTELAELLHYDMYSLSRVIKQKTGKNYQELVREKRLFQAAFLLKNTDKTVDSIANAVGYENIGFFHRIFRETFGMSPRNYRMQIR